MDLLKTDYSDCVFISIDAQAVNDIAKEINDESSAVMVYHLGRQLKTFKNFDASALRMYLDTLPKHEKFNKPDFYIISKDSERILDEIKN